MKSRPDCGRAHARHVPERALHGMHRYTAAQPSESFLRGAMREPADLLIEPRWLLPVVPQTVLEGHALVVGGGRIVALGPAEQLRARYQPSREVRRTQHALIPGLINAHTRASLTLLRALHPYGGGKATPHAAGADFVRDGTRLAIAQMLKAGITCFADLSEHPEEAARVAAAAQVRAAIALPISEAAGAEGLSAQLARAERLWDEYRADARLSLFFAPVGAALASEPLLQRLRRVADELDARLALPLEGLAAAAEVRDAAAEERSALARLCALGLVRPGTAAIAAQPLSAADLALLERHGAALVSCPQQGLRAGGAAVPLLPGDRSALGSGNPLKSGALDVRGEARTAALLSGFDATTALRLATLGGATALGLQAHLGSLEPGKLADLVCLELDELGCASAAGLADALIFGAAPVSDLWSGGRLLLSERRLLGFDEAELAGLAGSWARRLKLGAAA